MKPFGTFPPAVWQSSSTGVLLAAIWLVFLAFPALSVWNLEDPLARMVGILALVLFVPAYLRSFTDMGNYLDPRERRRQLFRGALILLAVGILFWAIGTKAFSMFPFLAAFTSYGLWAPVRIPATIAVAGGGMAVMLWAGVGLSDGGAILTVLVAIMGMITVKLVEHEAITAEHEQQRAVAEQRERMIRDVHDLVGHSLTVANLRLQLTERLFESDPGQAKAELEQTRAFLTEAQEELRLSVTGEWERPVAEETIRVVKVLRSNGIEVRVEGDPQEVRGPIVLVLGWVLREAATNVLRHAHATRVEITFTSGRFSLADDGDGYCGGEGSGLAGMRERVAAVGSGFSFGPSGLGGCEVTVTW